MMQRFEELAAESRVRRRERRTLLAPPAWGQGARGCAPWLATEGLNGLVEEAGLDPKALGEAFCKKLSISTCADDDAQSYVYEGEDEEEISTDLGEDHSTEPDLEMEVAHVIPSVGSASHATGECKPCAWFWKTGGCRNGAACLHCHLCGEGELRARKRAKGAAVEAAAEPNGSWDVVGSHRKEPRKVAAAAPGLAGPGLPLSPPPGLAPAEECWPGPLPSVPPAAQMPMPPPAAEAQLAKGSRPTYGTEVARAQGKTEAQATQEVIATLIANREQEGHSMMDLQELLETQQDIVGLASHSIGSVWHGTGLCRPCMWFWRPQGCENHAECLHCHLCPEGASKLRKKLSKTLAKQRKQEQRFHDHVMAERAAAAVLLFAADKVPPPRCPEAQPLPPLARAAAEPAAAPEPPAEPAPAPAAAPLARAPEPAPSPHEREPAGLAELPSVGSALHAVGRCKPCAWFWKAQGCKNGQACEHCHACPEWEMQSRKKAKVAALRSMGMTAEAGQ